MSNTEPIESVFDGIGPMPVRRKNMLPVWIKVFCWIFLTAGTLTALILIFKELTIGTTHYDSSGELVTDHFHWVMTTPIVMLLLKSWVAYALLREKEMAIRLAIIEAAVYFAMIAFAIIAEMFFIRADPRQTLVMCVQVVILVPYFAKLRSIQSAWRNAYAGKAVN